MWPPPEPLAGRRDGPKPYPPTKNSIVAEPGEPRQPANQRKAPTRITFDGQLKPCGGNGRLLAPPPDVNSNRSPPPPGNRSDRPALDCKLARNTERAFLRQLIANEPSEESRRLQDRLAQADRDDKCLRRAVFLMVVLFLLSVAGLTFCAILLPEVFRNSRHFVLRSLCDLGIGSLISQVVFLGYLFWHRAVVSSLHRECRLLVLALARSQLKGGTAPTLVVALPGASPGASASAPQQ
jgi:hypothetical protein